MRLDKPQQSLSLSAIGGLRVLNSAFWSLDGYEVLRQLREQSPASGPFAAAVTGFGQPEDLRRTREAGFDYHLVKPFGPDVLMEMLESLRRE